MVLKKNEVLDAALRVKANEVKEMCRAIDTALAQNYKPGGEVSVSVRNAYGVAADHVIKLYHEAGWTVKAHSDQREGDWLTLS